jgi:hypothetical protein
MDTLGCLEGTARPVTLAVRLSQFKQERRGTAPVTTLVAALREAAGQPNCRFTGRHSSRKPLHTRIRSSGITGPAKSFSEQRQLLPVGLGGQPLRVFRGIVQPRADEGGGTASAVYYCASAQ